MKIKILIAALLLITAIGTPIVAGEERSTILTAERTNETITIDGYASEPSWARASELVVTVQDGSIGKVDVHIRALYDDAYIYFYATWPDKTENTIRDTWIYDAENKSWYRWSEAGNEIAKNEDRIIFLWNIQDSMKGFNIAGCAMTCHGDRHHTNAEGERADTWHWKTSRTDPAGYCDDKYWNSSVKEGTDEKALHAGRHGDEAVSGGYRDNKQIIIVDGSNVSIPKYYEPNPTDEMDAKFLFQSEIDNGEAVEVTGGTTVKNGTIAPGFILERPVGSRGDIESKGVWLDGRWHVELKRKLDTGHDDDVQFDTTKLYRFGVAICDNVGGFEAYGKGHSFDLGARTLEFGGRGSEEITQLVLIKDYLIAARAYIDRGESGLAFSEINYALALYNEISDVVGNRCPYHHILIKKGFGDSKRNPSVDNIDALMKEIDDVVLLFQGKMEPHEPTWDLKLIIMWAKIQLYVFILLAFFAMFPLYKTIQVGRGPELRRMSIFLLIVIIPIFLEGVGRIGILSKIHFLQNFSFMTNEYATLLWAMLMFVALFIARAGFGEVEETIQSLKTLSTELEQKVKERTREVNLERDKLEDSAEKLKRANELQNLFTDIIRHDLLNPIGIIGNITDILEEDKNLKDSTEIPVIKRNVKKLEEIIHNASDYAKLESVEKLEKVELDLAKLIKNVIDDFGPYIKDKGMNVEFKPEGEYKINASVIIESVFVNLLSNAIKYSPDGTDIKIAIEDSGKNWKISFADRGEGISDEYKEPIFDRFTRKDKGGVKGTGLGLAIVKRIVEMHGGRVWVEDNPEGGSIFYMEIPKSDV